MGKNSKCKICSKQFKYESELKRHEISHIPQFECKVCSKKFSFLSAVRRHEKQHQRTEHVSCGQCKRFFRDDTLLKRHVQYAHKGTFTCEKCQSTFNSEVALKIHSKTHKPKEERRYHCQHSGCSKSFNFSHHLKHHELTHTDTKQFYCNTCGKGFIQLHHLKVHKKNHEARSRVTCPVPDCEKTFLTESGMRGHLGSHRNFLDELVSQYGLGNTYKVKRNDTVLCNSCGKILSKSSLARHNMKCTANHVTGKGSHEDVNETNDNQNSPFNQNKLDKDDPNEALPKIELDGLDIELKGNDSSELDGPLSSCKIVLGGCVAENGSNKKDCLCEQMNVPDTDKTSNENTHKFARKAKSDETKEVKNDMCEGCECAKICSSTAKAKCKGPMPEIEYRLGGIVKLKETFDFDIDIKQNDGGDKLKNNYKDLSSVLLHSCKDVIGNCIVSGNSTMGEGCLCAKMTMNNQGNIDQEIEDITPCPKMW